MKYVPLIWASLRRKPARTILTLLSIVIAFFLFGILQGMTAGFDQSISQLSDARLRVTSKVSTAESLPLAHLGRIENVPGVEGVAVYSYFGGYWREPRFRLPGGAVDLDRITSVFPELLITEEHREAMRQNRTGVLIGRELAYITGWKIGERVPITSGMWTRKDGSNTWEFDVVGIYDVSDKRLRTNEFWINYRYFDEARAEQQGTVTLFVAGVGEAASAATVAQEIDDVFKNSAFETDTRNEKDWMRGRLDAIGDIGYVVNAVSSAVVFTLLILIGNTMMQSVRERIREFAVLETYGFSVGSIVGLVIVEAMLICLIPAMIGLALAANVFPTVYREMGLSTVPLSETVVALGVAIAAGLALFSSTVPVSRISRLDVAAALTCR